LAPERLVRSCKCVSLGYTTRVSAGGCGCYVVPYPVLVPATLQGQARGLHSHDSSNAQTNRPLYRNLDRVYCGGDAVEQALAIDPRIRNLKRIYSCIAISRDADPPLSAHPVSKGLLFLYVGRFVRDKGLESLIKGFKNSLQTHRITVLQ
jgi:glycosyltransferase involved in cell wall biosynthesis